MELHEALSDIQNIRRQMAVTEKFRGYRAVPVACGALLALVGAALQTAIIADPMRDLRVYLVLWIGVATIAGALPACDIFLRHRERDSSRGMLTRLACEQFAPCVLAGGLVTGIVAAYQPQVGWMLPGLWAVLFSLGMFASFRLLPATIFAVGAWYLLCGCTLLALGPETAGLAPWTMAVTFGFGQLSTAVVLIRQRTDGVPDDR